MSDLNYIRIAQILGGKLAKTARPDFGGFGFITANADRLRVLDCAEKSDTVERKKFRLLASVFERVREHYELDRVLVDPALRTALLRECEVAGISHTPRAIFKRLQSFRKASSLGIKLKPTLRAAGIDPEPFFYAAEMGFVQLSYVSDASVDDVVTDPAIGEMFDELCFKIAPHGSSMEFRWAALCLRKMRTFSRKKADRLLAITPWRIEQRMPHRMALADISIPAIPTEAGVFAVTENADHPSYLYVSAAKNLRRAIEPFRNAEPFRAISESYWNPDVSQMQLRFGVIKRRWLGTSARDLSLRLIRDRHPLFNLPVEFNVAEAA